MHLFSCFSAAPLPPANINLWPTHAFFLPFVQLFFSPITSNAFLPSRNEWSFRIKVFLLRHGSSEIHQTALYSSDQLTQHTRPSIMNCTCLFFAIRINHSRLFLWKCTSIWTRQDLQYICLIYIFADGNFFFVFLARSQSPNLSSFKGHFVSLHRQIPSKLQTVCHFCCPQYIDYMLALLLFNEHFYGQCEWVSPHAEELLHADIVLYIESVHRVL